MKNLTIVAILVAIITIGYSCNNQEQNSADISNTLMTTSTDNIKMEETKTIEKTETTGKVVHITTQEFKEKVFNYEANKEWKYNGNKPCIVDFYAVGLFDVN